MNSEPKSQPVLPARPRPVPARAACAGRQAGRWWAAVAAGVLLCIPIGWLLSYGGGLPFNLGLFFFMLLGLLIGATMYRVGQAARPVPAGQLRIGIALVVLTGWGLSIWVEAYEFPSDVADRALEKFRRRPEGMTPERIKQETTAFVRAYLHDNYPPGGTIGYVRWVLTSNRLAVEIDDVPLPVRLRFTSNRGWWLFRVVASLGLLTYAVRSQVCVLRDPEKAPPSDATVAPEANAVPSPKDDAPAEVV